MSDQDIFTEDDFDTMIKENMDFCNAYLSLQQVLYPIALQVAIEKKINEIITLHE